MSNLCCVLEPAMQCQDCLDDVCRNCIKIYHTTPIYKILSNKVGNRGVSWICSDCISKRQ